MSSWLSCLPSQLPFLGPAHAFQGQVKPTLIFRAWDEVVLLSPGVEKPQSTLFPILFLQRSRNLPSWLQLTHRQREGPSWSLLPGPSRLGEGWVSGHSLLLTPASHLRGDSLGGPQLCIPGQTKLHWSYFPNLTSKTHWKRSLYFLLLAYWCPKCWDITKAKASFTK